MFPNTLTLWHTGPGVAITSDCGLFGTTRKHIAIITRVGDSQIFQAYRMLRVIQHRRSRTDAF